MATVRADELRVHSPVRHEYWTGRATREALGRLLTVPVPPEPLLRLLAGLPPLPYATNAKDWDIRCAAPGSLEFITRGLIESTGGLFA